MTISILLKALDYAEAKGGDSQFRLDNSTDKLAEGIRQFAIDQVKLEGVLKA